MIKDFYVILQVPRTATENEIKAAFRKLAMQYHPDRPGGDEAKMKEISEAYTVLTKERAQYDAILNPPKAKVVVRFSYGSFYGMGGGQGTSSTGNSTTAGTWYFWN